MDRGGAAARNREMAARDPKRLAQDVPAGSATTEFRREPLLETAVVEAARRRQEDRVARGEQEVARPAVRGRCPRLRGESLLCVELFRADPPPLTATTSALPMRPEGGCHP